MLQWATLDPLNGQQITGHLAADNLGYVMVDDGPDYPYGAYVFTPGFGDSTVPPPPLPPPPLPPPSLPPPPVFPPSITDRQLAGELYRRHKPAFWIGGGILSVLALKGLFNFIRH